MAFIPAKKIESILKKENISVDGYDVIQSIDMDIVAEAERLGMSNGITRGFEFSSQYSVEGVVLTFYVDIIKDYREISPDQEIPYYYPSLDSCKIKITDKPEKVIDMDVYWKV